MTDLIDLLILQRRQTYVKLHFPHNVSLKKKLNGNLNGHAHRILFPLTTYHLAKQSSHSYTVLLLFNCCTLINKHCYVIRSLILHSGMWAGTYDAG